VKLIYFSPVRWASHRQRPHEFVAWLQQRFDARVLWVEPYPVRLPRWQDLRRPNQQENADGTLPAWLQTISPPALPLEPFAWGRALNRSILWRNVTRQLQTFAATEATILAIGKPSGLALQTLESLDAACSIYDAMDDFPAFFEGRSKASVAAIEQKIAAGVSIVCTSSSVLEQRLQAAASTVLRVPNGLSARRVETARVNCNVRSSQSFGYVGTIAAWFDWDWICRLARDWPERQVELIGPLFQAPRVSLPDNVRLLPALPHEQALCRMQSFAAGLIPFQVNQLTAAVDPLKYYEYRGLGLSVISTPFGEMQQRSLDARVLLTDDPVVDRARIAGLIDVHDTVADATVFCQQNDWSQRFDLLLPAMRGLFGGRFRHHLFG